MKGFVIAAVSFVNQHKNLARLVFVALFFDHVFKFMNQRRNNRFFVFAQKLKEMLAGFCLDRLFAAGAKRIVNLVV